MSTLPTSPEDQFESLLIQLKIPHVRQHRPIKGRRWAFDFAIPEKKIGFEVDGGIYSETKYKDRKGNDKIHRGGRHCDPQGYQRDCMKYIHAQREGWRVVRIPSPWLKHYNRHKPNDYMITYEDLKEIIRELVEKD